MNEIPPIIQVGEVLLSSDILTKCFCCDLSRCKGRCCVHGDAGAPVTLDEVAAIEECLDVVWNDLSASAQGVIEKNGLSYVDQEGDLVTSIVRGRDCVFTCYEDDICLCALERAYRAGKTQFSKPISCALYPIREKTFTGGVTGLNYNEWFVCRDAVEHGKKLQLRVYQFLKQPLIRRFGEEWYQELELVAQELIKGSIIR